MTKGGNTHLEVAVFARFLFLSHMQVLFGFVCAPSEDELTLVIVRFGCFSRSFHSNYKKARKCFDIGNDVVSRIARAHEW